MELSHLDHLVLTVADIDRTVAFYTQVLGMTVVSFGAGRTALAFGQQKINLHQLGKEFDPKATRPTVGSADLCFIAQTPLEEVVQHLNTQNVAIVEGLVTRTGAQGILQSVYFYDPDGNLIEVSNYSA